MREGVLGCLARSYLFEGLSAEQLAPLADQATTRRLLRGEVLIRVGDRADELYVVLEGEVKDSVVDANGEEVVHFLHGPGMTLGEPGFFAVEHRRIVEVVATAPSVLIRLDRRVLIPFMNRHPVTKDRALEKLASNERWQTTMISSLATKPLADRLVLRLLELVDSSPQRRAGLAATPQGVAGDVGGDGRGQPGERQPGIGGVDGQRRDPPGEGSVPAGRREAAAAASG